MEAAGSERAVLLGFSGGGPTALLFAAMYPERVEALVLVSTMARFGPAPGYPCGDVTQRFTSYLRHFAETAWGEGRTLEWLAPTLAHSESARRKIGRWERMSVSPKDVATFLRLWQELDVRELLPAIRVPTLVIQREQDVVVTRCHGRYLAEHIPQARYVEVPGGMHILWVEPDQVLAEVERFLREARAPIDLDRVLSTVLVTEVVRTCEDPGPFLDKAVPIVEAFRGRLVEGTGGGVLATFDGPGRAVRCADAVRNAMHELGVEVRCGLHTGEIEISGDDIGGFAVDIARRVCGLADAGEILVSSTIKDLVVGSGLTFVDRGVHTLPGVPDEWRLFVAKT